MPKHILLKLSNNQTTVHAKMHFQVDAQLICGVGWSWCENTPFNFDLEKHLMWSMMVAIDFALCTTMMSLTSSQGLLNNVIIAS